MMRRFAASFFFLIALFAVVAPHLSEARPGPFVRRFPNPKANASFTSCASLAGGGCAGWWSADTGVSTTGSTVTSVTDRSGNAHTMSQAPTGPTLATGTFSSFSSPGSDTKRLQTSGAVVSAYPFEYLIVANQTGSVGANLYLIDTSGNTAAFFQSGANGSAFTLGGSGTLANKFPTDSTIHVLDIAWGTSNTTFALYFDGAVQTVSISYTSAISPTAFTLGNFGGSSLSNSWKGNIYEAIVFSRILSSTDRTSVCTYLCSKYAVTCTCSIALAPISGGAIPLFAIVALGALVRRSRAANDNDNRRAA